MGVESAPSCGDDALGQLDEPQPLQRSARARSSASTPSRKVSVTNDRPKRLMLRMRASPGMPLTARSMGIETWRSISSAGWPG